MGKWLEHILTAGLVPQPTRPPEVDWLGSMQRLDVRDGDLIVLRTQLSLSTPTKNNLCECNAIAIQQLGVKATVMVLEEGMDIGVLGKEVDRA